MSGSVGCMGMGIFYFSESGGIVQHRAWFGGAVAYLVCKPVGTSYCYHSGTIFSSYLSSYLMQGLLIPEEVLVMYLPCR